MNALPAGRHLFRSDDGYEAARRATVWHQRVPERYPEVIVQAADADDVIAGLRYAKANGLKVSIVEFDLGTAFGMTQKGDYQAYVSYITSDINDSDEIQRCWKRR